jgi:TetR/AcrR family transcriptional repressor of nem operon
MDKKEEIMAAGRLMAQAGGYHSLSFRDIAEAVGIKSASVHYYFPTKGDLGAALLRRYSEDMAGYLEGLAASHVDVKSTLRSYTAVFRQPLVNGNRMCMCGIMAAEHDGLPPQVREEVNRFTDVNVNWLTKLMLTNKVEPTKAKAERRAVAIFSAIEGAQLVARGRGDVKAFDDTLDVYRVTGPLL